MTEEKGPIAIRRTPFPLCDVAWNRDGGSSHLTRQAVPFLFRERLCFLIHADHQIHSILPNSEIPIGSRNIFARLPAAFSKRLPDAEKTPQGHTSHPPQTLLWISNRSSEVR